MGAGETVFERFGQMAVLLAKGLLHGALKLRHGIDHGLLGAGQTIFDRFDQTAVLLAKGLLHGAEQFAPTRLRFIEPLLGFRIPAPELGPDVLQLFNRANAALQQCSVGFGQAVGRRPQVAQFGGDPAGLPVHHLFNGAYAALQQCPVGFGQVAGSRPQVA